MKSEEISIARQLPDKHIPAATNQHAKIEEAAFSVRESHVEAGSNTSIVALRVVGGDEKGIQCLRVKPGNPISG
jgi:hypothetical protein